MKTYKVYRKIYTKIYTIFHNISCSNDIQAAQAHTQHIYTYHIQFGISIPPTLFYICQTREVKVISPIYTSGKYIGFGQTGLVQCTVHPREKNKSPRQNNNLILYKEHSIYEPPFGDNKSFFPSSLLVYYMPIRPHYNNTRCCCCCIY